MINRRKFLQYISVVTGGVTLGYIGYRSIYPMQKALTFILVKDLEGLKVNPVEVEAYIKTISIEKGTGLTYSQERLLCLYTNLPFETIPLPFRQRYLRLRSQVVGNFLLSTDFFLNKMDESKEIKYSGTVYKTYGSACVNPFSSMYYG